MKTKAIKLERLYSPTKKPLQHDVALKNGPFQFNSYEKK